MAYESYADFLNALEQAGELIRISEPIATELEITELADREMKKTGGGKALLIERPTVNGEVSAIPLAINTMGSTKRMAMALGLKASTPSRKNLGRSFRPSRRPDSAMPWPCLAKRLACAMPDLKK